MEILKSKINEYPNYFLLNITRNTNSSNQLFKLSFNKINNNKLLKSSNIKPTNFNILSKDIETQTSFRKNNDNFKITKNKINPYIAFENKTIKNYLSSYTQKPKLKHININLNKLFLSYFPSNLDKNENKKIINNNSNNNISCFIREKNKKLIEIMKKNKSMRNKNTSLVNKNNCSTSYKSCFSNIKLIDEFKNSNTQRNVNVPKLIKDIEISKLLNKLKKKQKTKSNPINRTPVQTNKYLYKTQYNKIFISPDILKHKKTAKDYFYSKLMNTKFIFSKNNNKTNIIFNNDQSDSVKNLKYTINKKIEFKL